MSEEDSRIFFFQFNCVLGGLYDWQAEGCMSSDMEDIFHENLQNLEKKRKPQKQQKKQLKNENEDEKEEKNKKKVEKNEKKNAEKNEKESLLIERKEVNYFRSIGLLFFLLVACIITIRLNH